MRWHHAAILAGLAARPGLGLAGSVRLHLARLRARRSAARAVVRAATLIRDREAERRRVP